MLTGKIALVFAGGVALAGCSSSLRQPDEPRLGTRPPNPARAAALETAAHEADADATESEAAAKSAEAGADQAEAAAVSTEKQAAEINDDTWKKLTRESRRLATESRRAAIEARRFAKEERKDALSLASTSVIPSLPAYYTPRHTILAGNRVALPTTKTARWRAFFPASVRWNGTSIPSARASREQNAGIVQITGSIHHIDQVTQNQRHRRGPNRVAGSN